MSQAKAAFHTLATCRLCLENPGAQIVNISNTNESKKLPVSNVHCINNDNGTAESRK